MKILIIEDQEKLAKMLKNGLEKEGYAADYLTDGESGQRRIELHHNDYDLIVLDLMLPKKSGLEICKAVRKKKIFTPILILTAKNGTDDKVTLLDAGADDYLVKPFSFKELLARIRALLRRPDESLPEELKVKGLRLNPSTRKVYRNGTEVGLTLKEFRLLEYLMRHPNQVINREQLLDNIWDFAFDSFSNVVDVHINNLRKKLNGGKKSSQNGNGNGNGNGKVIETVRGVGYRIRT